MPIVDLNFESYVPVKFYYESVPVVACRDISLREAVYYNHEHPELNYYTLLTNVFAVLRDSRWVLAGSYGLTDHMHYVVLYELLELSSRKRGQRMFMVPAENAKIVTRIGDSHWAPPGERPVISSAQYAMAHYSVPENAHRKIKNCVAVERFVDEKRPRGRPRKNPIT